jgi:hypothetical protein
VLFATAVLVLVAAPALSLLFLPLLPSPDQQLSPDRQRWEEDMTLKTGFCGALLLWAKLRVALEPSGS